MTKIQCPCCNALTNVAVPREELACRFTGNNYRFILALARRPGTPVQTNKLAEVIWKDDPDGGPLDVWNSFAQMKIRVNRVIMPLGWEVTAKHRQGYFLTIREGMVE